MLNGLRQIVTVQPGGLIELRSPELPPGATVEVIVLLESKPAQQSLTRFIGAAPGNFETPEAVDQFVRQERDAWDS